MFRQKHFTAFVHGLFYFVFFNCSYLLYHSNNSLAPPTPHYIGGSPSPGRHEETASCSLCGIGSIRYDWQGLPYGVSRASSLAPCQSATLAPLFLANWLHLSNSKFCDQIQAFHRIFLKPSYHLPRSSNHALSFLRSAAIRLYLLLVSSANR